MRKKKRNVLDAQIVPIADPIAWGKVFGSCRSTLAGKCHELAIYRCSVTRERKTSGRVHRIDAEYCREHAEIFAERYDVEVPAAAVIIPSGSPDVAPEQVYFRRKGPKTRSKGVRWPVNDEAQLELEAFNAGLDFSSYIRHLIHISSDRARYASKPAPDTAFGPKQTQDTVSH